MSVDHGTVRPGYEPVRDAFLRGSGTFGRGGGAYCAYVAGEPVVDLWGGAQHPGVPWSRGTTTVIMSATKALASLCLQILADRGRLDIDAPVVDYWPEFAQNGKESTLVRHVLLHTAGVLGVANQPGVLGLDGAGWDAYDRISEALASAVPEWPPGTRHGYHAMTYGWLAGELVRRVTGESIGTFFAREVAGPLGLETWIGTPPVEQHRVAHVYRSSTAHLPRVLRKAYEASLVVARDPATMSGRAFLGNGVTNGIEQLEVIFNDPRVIGAEFPAGGATSTARALARLWSVLALGGELDGVRVVSEASAKAWGQVVQSEPDVLMADVPLPRMLADASAAVPRTLGYLGNGRMPGLGHRFGPNPEAYGAEGLGGQFAFCDPASAISVGYVRSDLAVVDVLQPHLTDVVYACARAQGHEVYQPPRPSLVKGLVESAAGAFLRRKVAVPTVSGDPSHV